VIIKSVEFIGPETASLSVPWTEFLLHGVPTHLDLEVTRRDVEGVGNELCIKCVYIVILLSLST
jgi:hypothetical protein